MKNKSTLISFSLLMLAWSILCASPSWAKGNPKGILDDDERYFIDHTIYPILISSKLCVSATADCIGREYIFCLSDDSLSCDVHGITDKKIIKEILLAVLNSGLPISSFTFWRSKYHEQSFFEKPLVEFIDRTGGK